MNRPRRIGPLVAACVAGGILSALLLPLFATATAQENEVAGVALLGFALGLAALAWLSSRWTDQPQRWTVLPATVLTVLGIVLILWPGSVKNSVLTWAWPPAMLALLVVMAMGAHAQLRSRARRAIVYPVLLVAAIACVTGMWETVREREETAGLQMRGQLVDVGGYRMHMECSGAGSPTVVLIPGAGEVSSTWGWIAPPVTRATRTCVYDRAGRAWSEDGPGAQDGNAIAADLRRLLDKGGEQGPFVVVGHSFGGLYTMCFAAQYPHDVAGLVLLDSTSPDQFKLPIYPRFYAVFSRVSALFPSLARLGVARVTNTGTHGTLPPQASHEEDVFWATARLARNQHDEWISAPAAMREAHALTSLGARPLAVLTALRGAQDGWVPLQDNMARVSTNVVHRTLPNVEHSSLVEEEGDAREASQAILDVVSAVRDSRPLVQTPAQGVPR